MVKSMRKNIEVNEFGSAEITFTNVGGILEDIIFKCDSSMSARLNFDYDTERPIFIDSRISGTKRYSPRKPVHAFNGKEIIDGYDKYVLDGENIIVTIDAAQPFETVGITLRLV